MKFATLDLWIIAIYCVGLISLATWVSKSNGKEKTSEEPSNANVPKDKDNMEEIDSLRQQIEELRDIITKKNP